MVFLLVVFLFWLDFVSGDGLHLHDNERKRGKTPGCLDFGFGGKIAFRGRRFLFAQYPSNSLIVCFTLVLSCFLAS